MTAIQKKEDLTLLVSHLPEAALILASDGKILAANSAAMQLCEKTDGQLTETPIADLAPRTVSRSRPGTAEDRETDAHSRIFALLRPDGTQKHISAAMGAARQGGGERVVILRDVTTTTRQTAVDCVFATLYENACAGLSVREACTLFCQEIAKVMDLPLVVCAHRSENGSLSLEATSAENNLWLELQRLPERWDGTVVCNGPGALSIRYGIPVVMRTAEEGFMPWRQAAESEWIRAAGAWPFKSPQGQAVLELFGKREDLFSREDREVLMPEIVRRLESLLVLADSKKKPSWRSRISASLGR